MDVAPGHKLDSLYHPFRTPALPRPSIKCYNANGKGRGGWLFRECADDLRRYVQEEDGCNERQREHEDDEWVSRDEMKMKGGIAGKY